MKRKDSEGRSIQARRPQERSCSLLVHRPKPAIDVHLRMLTGADGVLSKVESAPRYEGRCWNSREK